MFSKELEEVIEAALADGVLTEKERAVLHKRAAAEGVDPDELDVVIDGRLAKAKKQEDWLKPAPPSTLMSNKIGNVQKCPNCGAPYQPGTAECLECGHVFQHRDAVKSSRQFAEGIQAITEKWGAVIAQVSKEEEYNREGEQKTNKVWDAKNARDKEIKNFITNFPIPLAKDDLLEFIADMAGRRHTKAYEDEYRAKLKEALAKSHILFPNDPQFDIVVKKYEKLSWENLSSGTKEAVCIAILFIVLLIIGLITD